MSLTLASYADRYLSVRLARCELCPDTARNQRCHLRGLVETFGRRPLQQLGVAAIERWLETTSHLAAASRRAQLSTVRTFCRWMVTTGAVRHDPTVGVARVRQPRSVPRALPAAAVSRTLHAAPDGRALLIVILMVHQGLRCCEVANLEVADYDPVGGTLRVIGKGGHERVLPVTVSAAVALNRYLAETGIVGGPLIRSKIEPSRGLRPDTISGMVSGWMGDAGIKRGRRDGVSAHALRHTAASDVLDRCHDVRTVQMMLGHASIATTQIYLRCASLDQLREAMDGRTYGTAA